MLTIPFLTKKGSENVNIKIYIFHFFLYFCSKPAGSSLGPEYVSHFVTVCFFTQFYNCLVVVFISCQQTMGYPSSKLISLFYGHGHW